MDEDTGRGSPCSSRKWKVRAKSLSEGSIVKRIIAYAVACAQGHK
jgi:hypothetical protein